MLLDLRTIYFIIAVSCLVLGVLQFAAYATGRFERWPLWWGGSNLLVGIGSLLVALREFAPPYVSIDGGNVITIAGYMLMFFAVRIFAGRPIAWRSCWLVIPAACLPVVFFMSNPEAVSARLLYVSIICGLCDLAVAREALGMARRERLYSAGLLVGLYASTTMIFAVRSFLAATGRIGGPDPFGSSPIHSWMAVSAVVFVMLRNMVMVLMAAERSGNKLIALARRDPLTGTLNRSGLAGYFSSLKAQRVSLLVIDIDHFKTLNDTHGHAVGDDVLRIFAAAAQGLLRTEDVLARQGGDEFVAVLRGQPLDAAVAVAERIRDALTEAVAVRPDLAASPTLSIGAAEGKAGLECLDAILQRADEALYRGKRQGRNRVEAYRPEHQAA